jgi:hypothetical protein
MAYHPKPNNDAEILARTLLEVLNTSDGRALLDTLMDEQRTRRQWKPTYVIEEQELP